MPSVASLLDGLSQRDEQELFEALSYRRAKASPGAAPSRDEASLWDAINAALAIHRAAPLPVFVQGYGKAKYAEAVAQMHEFVTESCGPAMRQVVRDRVVAKALRALVLYMDAIGIPLTPKTVISNFGMLASAVDAQFPGYAAARLLHRIAPVV